MFWIIRLTNAKKKCNITLVLLFIFKKVFLIMKEVSFGIDLSAENKDVVEDIRKFVKEKGIEAVNEDGDTLLMLAIKTGNMEAIKEILTYPQDFDIQNKWKRTALTRAAAINNTDVVRSLLTKGAKPDIQDKDGMTAAIFAAINNNPTMIIDLKRAKANFEIKDNTDWSALMWAISEKSFDAAEKLIQVGASVEGIKEWMDAIKTGGLMSSDRNHLERLIQRAKITRSIYKGNGGR